MTRVKLERGGGVLLNESTDGTWVALYLDTSVPYVALSGKDIDRLIAALSRTQAARAARRREAVAS